MPYNKKYRYKDPFKGTTKAINKSIPIVVTGLVGISLINALK